MESFATTPRWASTTKYLFGKSCEHRAMRVPCGFLAAQLAGTAPTPARREQMGCLNPLDNVASRQGDKRGVHSQSLLSSVGTQVRPYDATSVQSIASRAYLVCSST